MSSFLSAFLILALSPQTPSELPTPKPAAAVALEVSVPTYGNSTCPIMGKPASDALFVDTDLGRVYVCCPPCYKKVQRDEEVAFSAAYPAQKSAENKTCPISGKPLPEQPELRTIQGIEVGFCCAECATEGLTRPQTTLVKAMRPGTREVRNTTCPISGEPIGEGLVCLIGDDLIHLSSLKCVDEVKKDPSGALAKARENAAKNPPSANGSAPVPAADGGKDNG